MLDTLGQMTPRDWKILREDFSIRVRGDNVPEPIRAWNELAVAPHLLQAIARAGYRVPTPIQMQAIPCGLLYRDMIGLAETGSGS